MKSNIVEVEQSVAIQIPEENQVSLAHSTEKTTEENLISWADSVRIKLESLPPSTTAHCSIYRVHDKFRRLNESAYTPQLFSIGPFHRGEKSLVVMDDHKKRYVKDLLSRIAVSGIDYVKECEACLEKLEDVARKCYSEPIDLSKNEFLEMMFIDGLFLIELFIKNADNTIKVERGDPIFGRTWGLSSLVHDLVLLENQLPMVVLDHLFNVLALKEKLKGVPLNILALKFFNQLMGRDEKDTEKHFSECKGKHLLDLLGKTFHCLLPKNNDQGNDKPWISIPSVTELKRVGVKFLVSSRKDCLMDIKFNNGVMEIPHISIQDQTDALFRNCIAFEQYCDGNDTYIASYAHFMDSLIDSEEDVGILRKQGITPKLLGKNEDVATLFNNLCKEVTVTNFYYSGLCDRVNKHYETRWHAWKAILKRDYFNSPWAIISLVGVIILMILTLTSTLFGIFSFAIHKS